VEGRNSLRRFSETLSTNNERLFAVVLALSVAPIWFSPYLPMIDLPQHAGQVAALQEMWRGNSQFTSVYDINWFTPYLFGYLLLYMLSLVLPIPAAAQLLVCASMATLPLAAGRLLSVAGADQRWKWLTIPGAYSFAFYWGFLSFMIAAPIALLFVAQAIQFAREPTTRRGIGIAFFCLFLFACHIVVLAFSCVVAFSYIVGRHARDYKTMALRAIPFLAPVPLVVAWLVITFEREPSAQANAITWGPISYRLTQLLLQPSGRDTFDPLITSLTTVAIFALPALLGSRLNRRSERWLPFAFGLILFLVVPHYAIGTAYLFQRLGVFLLPLWLLMWDPPDTNSRSHLNWLAVGLVVVCSFAQVGRFAAFAKETQDFRYVMQQMEPRRKVAAMIVDKGSPLFGLPVYLHFGLWYQTERAGIVEFNFTEFLPQLVRRRSGVEQGMTDFLSWYPTEFRWSQNGGDTYEYFLVKYDGNIAPTIFKDRRNSVELVTQRGWWWLYKNKAVAR
jgi:hypothetical protein